MTSRFLALRNGAATAVGVTPLMSRSSSCLARSSASSAALRMCCQPVASYSSSSSSSPFFINSSSYHTTTVSSSSSSILSLHLQNQNPHQHQQLLQIRYKHSARQLNLKIINHPSLYRRRRREERQEQLLQLLDVKDDVAEPQEHERDTDVQDDFHVKVMVGTLYRSRRATIRAKPRYPTWFTPEFLPNGWSAPPPPSSSSSDAAAAADPSGATLSSSPSSSSSNPPLPFFIRRTGHKPNDAVGFLPVYSDHGRNDGTKVTTRIKKIQGNVQEFVRELQAVLYQHIVVAIQETKAASDEEPPTSSSSSSSSSLHPLLQLPPPLVRIPPIRIRAHGDVVEVEGNHVRTVKTWLAGLGF